MANRTPEQDLINEFVGHLQTPPSNTISIQGSEIINANCKTRKYADIEFTTKTGQHWVIEAKSHLSKDKHNSVHKIFGELLKETGKGNREKCHYAILIPTSAVDFYSRAFQSIGREKFLAFGKLIPIDTVFTSDMKGIGQLTWGGLYDAHKSSIGQ